MSFDQVPTEEIGVWSVQPANHAPASADNTMIHHLELGIPNMIQVLLHLLRAR